MLTNEKLDSYFEKNKDDITNDIFLYKYFDGYKLNDECIRNYQNTLKDKLVTKLFQPVNEFSIYKYITREVTYPFIDESYANASKLLPLLDSKSEGFLQYTPSGDKTAAGRYLFIHLCNDKERTNWENGNNRYFNQRPATESVEALNKVVVVQIDRLKVSEVTMLRF